MTRTLVCMPTYNEADGLAAALGRLTAVCPDVDVLVIDDGSPDGTGVLAERLAAADPRVSVVHRLGKGGLGSAYAHAFDWGRARYYDLFVEMDADGSHRPEDLGALLDEARAGADVVLGTRWMPGGSTVGWPRRRRLLSRAGNTYARRALRLPLRDATGGFRVYRAAALDVLRPGEVASHGYCFQLELALRAVEAGLDVREVPITFVERTTGRSKMSGAIVVEAMWRVTVWALSGRGRRGPRPAAELTPAH